MWLWRKVVVPERGTGRVMTPAGARLPVTRVWPRGLSLVGLYWPLWSRSSKRVRLKGVVMVRLPLLRRLTLALPLRARLWGSVVRPAGLGVMWARSGLRLRVLLSLAWLFPAGSGPLVPSSWTWAVWVMVVAPAGRGLLTRAMRVRTRLSPPARLGMLQLMTRLAGGLP